MTALYTDDAWVWLVDVLSDELASHDDVSSASLLAKLDGLAGFHLCGEAEKLAPHAAARRLLVDRILRRCAEKSCHANVSAPSNSLHKRDQLLAPATVF